MTLHLLSASVLAAACLCAGCAQDRGTGAMGAGAQGTMCSDGTVLPPNSNCVNHGGVEGRGSQQRSSPSGSGNGY